MNSLRALPVPLFPAAILIGMAAMPISLNARPGEVAPGAGSIVERPGEVLAASMSDDGGVTLAGLFSRVENVSTPGIVRLKSGGRVDDSFSAGIGISPPATVPAPGSSAATVVPCPIIVQIGGGQQMLGDPAINNFPPELGGRLGLGVPVWFVLAGDGIPLGGVFSTITPQEPVIPQFAEDGKLVAIVSSPDAGTGVLRRKVRRLRLDTGVDDPGFTAAVSGVPLQVLPASGGGLWLLENDAGAFRVSRLAANGGRTGSIVPVDAAAVRAALQSMPLGAFALTSSQRGWSDQEGTWTHQLQFFAADGTFSTQRIHTGGSAPFFIEPDGSLLVENAAPAGVDLLQSARLRLLSRELPSGLPDNTFSAICTRRLLHRLTDGRLLADGTRRYLSNGTPDPAWSEPEVVSHGTVYALHSAPGGAVIGTGNFTLVDGQARPGIARWHADGSLDAAFIPAAAEGEVRDCAATPDGSVTVLRDGRLQRLRADGTLDAAFILTKPREATFPLDAWEEIEPLAGGAVLALVQHLPANWLTMVATIVHISPQGQCTELSSPWRAIPNGCGLLALPDGRYFHAGRRWLANGAQDFSFATTGAIGSAPLCNVGPDKWLFLRGGSALSAIPMLLRADGSVDGSSFSAAIAPSLTAAAASGAGHMLYTAEGNALVRRFADGRRDPSFRAAPLERRNESIPDGLPLLSAARNGGDGAVHSLLVHPVTGELWMAGDFTRTGNIVRAGIARLDASTPAGYSEWSDDIFPSPVAAGGDFDGDGATNWREYAAGTDPLLPDAVEGSALILTTHPLCLSAPQNPAAPEVFQTMEVSEDLRTWRTATGAEAVRKTVNGRPAFELAPAAGPRFVRIRYRSLL